MLFVLPFLVHAATFWIGAACAIAADLYLHKTHQWGKYKIQPAPPLSKFKRAYSRACQQSLINMVTVSLPFFTCTSWWIANRPSAAMSSSLPLRLLLAIGLTDVFFYISHRAMHTRWLYRSVHSRHHQWVAPVAVGATDAHWAEHLMTNVAPVAAAAFGAGLSSIPEQCLWSMIATASALVVHSGYNLPGVAFHDLHHESHSFNYGVTAATDLIFAHKIFPKFL